MSHPVSTVGDMDLLTVVQRFPHQESCTEHLERVRLGDWPCYALRGSVEMARRCEQFRVDHWNYHDCRSRLSVLSGTIMAKAKMPLQHWFLAIAIMANAKKFVSAHQMGP